MEVDHYGIGGVISVPTFTVTVGGKTRTLTEISVGTGLCLSHISQVFSGKKDPSMNSARKISRFFGVTLDRLDEILRETANVDRARGGGVASWREKDLDQRQGAPISPAA